jgi:hypothetical protein
MGDFVLELAVGKPPAGGLEESTTDLTKWAEPSVPYCVVVPRYGVDSRFVTAFWMALWVGPL